MLELEFNLKPSRQYLTLIVSTVLASASIIYFLPIETWTKCLGWLFVFTDGGYIFWRFGLLRSRYAIKSIRRHPDGQWLLQRENNTCHAELCGDSTLTVSVSILRFRTVKQRFPISCIIFRDSLSPVAYRRLLVAVKMGN